MRLNDHRRLHSTKGSAHLSVLKLFGVSACFTYALVVIVVHVSSLSSSVEGFSAPQPPLSIVYRQIAERACTEKRWPSNDVFLATLVYDDKSDSYKAPTFPKNQGPVGVFALINVKSNPSALPVIQHCRRLFYGFCSELEDSTGIYPYTTVESSKEPHISVAVFSEHPRLLSKAKERENWRPVSESKMQELEAKLTEAMIPHKHAIRLKLDSLLLTADGAMIAGFVCVNECNTYDRVKASMVSTASSVLGELTSRPKNLIHVTIGRVLGLKNRKKQRLLEPKQQQTICELVQRYNRQVLREAVQRMQVRSFDLTHMTLLRNVVWLLEENIEYKTWKLQ